MATISRVGFGQVEPNHLSGRRTAQIYAQLSANKNIKTLEQGQFVKYDTVKGEVNFEGKGEWMLVFNEIKLYDGWRETRKDFALQTKNFDGGIMTPRVLKTNVGDIFTTNTVGAANTSGNAEYAGVAIEAGDELGINDKGFLSTDGDKTEMTWVVSKVTTMSDGQPAVKVQRIK